MRAAQVLRGREAFSQPAQAANAQKSSFGASEDFMSLFLTLTAKAAEGEPQPASESEAFSSGEGLFGRPASDEAKGKGNDSLPADVAAAIGGLAFAAPVQYADVLQSEAAGDDLAGMAGARSVAAEFPAGAAHLPHELSAHADSGTAPDAWDKGFAINAKQGGAGDVMHNGIESQDYASAMPNILRQSTAAGQDNMEIFAGRGSFNFDAAISVGTAYGPISQAHTSSFRLGAGRMRADFEGGEVAARTSYIKPAEGNSLIVEQGAEVMPADAAGGSIAATQSRAVRAADGKSDRRSGTHEVEGAIKIGQAQAYGAAKLEAQRVGFAEIGTKETQKVELGPGQDIEIVSQLSEVIRNRAGRGDISTFKIRLKPEGLGEVTVKLIKNREQIEVELSARLNSTRELIARDLDTLRVALNTDTHNSQYRFVSVTLESNQTLGAGASLSGGEHGRSGGDTAYGESKGQYRAASRAEEKKTVSNIRIYSNRLIDYIA